MRPLPIPDKKFKTPEVSALCPTCYKITYNSNVGELQKRPIYLSYNCSCGTLWVGGDTLLTDKKGNAFYEKKVKK